MVAISFLLDCFRVRQAREGEMRDAVQKRGVSHGNREKHIDREAHVRCDA